MISSYIDRIRGGDDLSRDEASECLETIFKGHVDDGLIVDLLSALNSKGESVSEIVGFAEAMKASMLPIELPGNIIDVCGTGGTNKDRFNVSTASAFVLGACGVQVAKHGNRGSRRANGSFDFLEALGVDFSSVSNATHCFSKTGICFLFARLFHPAVAKVASARKKLGTRSIFNLLGPLCNPARVSHQIIGTTSIHTANKVATAISQLGITRAFVIVGGNGLDELSISAPSLIIQVEGGEVFEPFEFFPSTVFGPVSEDESGADAVENAAEFLRICREKDTTHPVVNWIALNSALALHCMNRVETIAEGVELVEHQFKNNLILPFVENVITASKGD